MLKDINDFMASLKEDDFMNSAKIINDLKLGISLPLEEHLDKLAVSIAAISNVCTMELIAKYHAWLNMPE